MPWLHGMILDVSGWWYSRRVAHENQLKWFAVIQLMDVNFIFILGLLNNVDNVVPHEMPSQLKLVKYLKK